MTTKERKVREQRVQSKLQEYGMELGRNRRRYRRYEGYFWYIIIDPSRTNFGADIFPCTLKEAENFAGLGN